MGQSKFRIEIDRLLIEFLSRIVFRLLGEETIFVIAAAQINHVGLSVLGRLG